MKPLMIIFAAALLLISVAFASQHSTGAGKKELRDKNSGVADEAREKESKSAVYEYLVVVGGRSNLSGSGVSSSMSKLSLDSSFRENYPLERNLDKLGAEGWELVSVVVVPPSEPIYYLKRAKDAGK